MRPFEGKYMYVIRGDGDFQPKRRQYFFFENLKLYPIKNRKHFYQKFIKNPLSVCKSIAI